MRPAPEVIYVMHGSVVKERWKISRMTGEGSWVEIMIGVLSHLAVVSAAGGPRKAARRRSRHAKMLAQHAHPATTSVQTVNGLVVANYRRHVRIMMIVDMVSAA